MDIRNWGLNRIMQLPDSCFGARWPVTVSQQGALEAVLYGISETALPESFVIWNFLLWQLMSSASTHYLRVSFGDQIPATAAEFNALEVMDRELGTRVGEEYRFYFRNNHSNISVPMRKPIHAKGRRLVGQFTWTELGVTQIGVTLTISSLPTEVPDWLVSG